MTLTFIGIIHSTILYNKLQYSKYTIYSTITYNTVQYSTIQILLVYIEGGGRIIPTKPSYVWLWSMEPTEFTAKNLEQRYIILTRGSGCSTPILLAPTDGWATPWTLLGDFRGGLTDDTM